MIQAGRAKQAGTGTIFQFPVFQGKVRVRVRICVKAVYFFLSKFDDLGDRDRGEGSGEVWDDTECRIRQPGDGSIELCQDVRAPGRPSNYYHGSHVPGLGLPVIRVFDGGVSYEDQASRAEIVVLDGSLVRFLELTDGLEAGLKKSAPNGGDIVWALLELPRTYGNHVFPFDRSVEGRNQICGFDDIKGK